MGCLVHFVELMVCRLPFTMRLACAGLRCELDGLLKMIFDGVIYLLVICLMLLENKLYV